MGSCVPSLAESVKVSAATLSRRSHRPSTSSETLRVSLHAIAPKSTHFQAIDKVKTCAASSLSGWQNLPREPR